MIPADQKFLTYEDAGKRIGMSAKFIAAEVKRGRLIPTVFSSHNKRIAELDLLKYLEQRRDLRYVHQRRR